MTRAATTCAPSCSARATASAWASDPRTPMRSVEPGVPPPAGPAGPASSSASRGLYRGAGRVRGCRRGRVPSPCTAHDGVEALRIAEAATRSHARASSRPPRRDRPLSQAARGDLDHQRRRRPGRSLHRDRQPRPVRRQSRLGRATRERVLAAARHSTTGRRACARSLQAAHHPDPGPRHHGHHEPVLPGAGASRRGPGSGAGICAAAGEQRRRPRPGAGVPGDCSRRGASTASSSRRRTSPSATRAWLARTALPTVLVNGEPEDGSLPAARSDNRGGGRLAAEHLLGLGHRRLGVVTVAEPAVPRADRTERGPRRAGRGRPGQR